VEVVVFEVDGRSYALPLEQVVEVVRMVAVTPVPEAPPWIAGVVNLRGAMIPMIDLRPRLGLPRTEIDPSQVFLVAAARGRTVGVLADRVEDVVDVASAAIERIEEASGSMGFVTGFTRSMESAVPIMDVEVLLRGANLSGDEDDDLAASTRHV
jgi:purine-binding chemotaxis protein CheW